MQKTLRISIVVLFCFGAFFTSANEVCEDDMSISRIETENYSPVDTIGNKKFHFNGSELAVARTDECTCKNGTCMRACDVKKTIPCDDQKMVCVCNPEFAKTTDDTCEYCDCGEGNNCIFDWRYNAVWWKTCICPEGYFFNEYRSEQCIPECGGRQPCKHDGTCARYESNYICECYRGTRGFLCEKVECGSKCQNRLEVDCLFDVNSKAVYCDCKNSSLYYDQEADICKACECGNGYCDYKFEDKNQKLVCQCHSGYKEFNGYCKKCNCGYGVDGTCEFDSNGEKICKCIDGSYASDGRCKPCNCHSSRYKGSKCELVDNVKRCLCEQGFKDVLGHCEDINECETNNTCPPLTKCYNTFGSFYCECFDGYRGTDGREVKPGEECVDIDECIESPYECWSRGIVKCVNLPGTYKCECQPGYEPLSYSDEPQATTCIEHRKHWGPAVIVVCITLLLIAVSFGVHKRVKNRSNSN